MAFISLSSGNPKFLTMKTTRDSEIEFYQILGKLFYAIAASDTVFDAVAYHLYKPPVGTFQSYVTCPVPTFNLSPINELF